MKYRIAGGAPFSHPRPLPRKTSFLDGYYKNGIAVNQAAMGDTLTYNVPGATSPVFLVQTVNGTPGYRGLFPIPMAPYMMTPGRDAQGTINNTVYNRDPAAGGSVIETDSIFIGPVTGPPASTGPTAPVCTDAAGNIVPCGSPSAPCGLDASTGQPIPWSIGASVAGQPNSVICPTPPAKTPAKAPAPGGSPTAPFAPSIPANPPSVFITPSTAPPAATAEDNSGTLILVAAAIALLMVAGGK
jgi:hypothetical protein